MALKGRKGPGLWMLWIFGVLLAGTGVYGPVFLDPYGAFVRSIISMTQSPGEASYATAFGKLGSGALPATSQEAILSYALERPIPGMEDLLRDAARRATDPDGRRALESALEAFGGKLRAADQIARALIVIPGAADSLQRLDPSTQALVASRLRSYPTATLQHANIDPALLQQLKAIRPPIARLRP